MNWTEEQKEFIQYKEHDSIILNAVAGSGKTQSCVGRLLYMLKTRKIKPSKILFFSYTNAAVNELKERLEKYSYAGVHVTTIHSFASSILAKRRKYKDLFSSPWEFAYWYKKHGLDKNATKKEKIEFKKKVGDLFERPDLYIGEINKYKTYKSEGIKYRFPEFYKEYCLFLKKTRKRDFVDLLTDTLYELRKDKTGLEGKWDYIFIDEYQDTSSIQLRILLELQAKQYHLIGDINQNIYQFNGCDPILIRNILKDSRNVIEMKLSKNFRSSPEIVDWANQYSSIEAVPHNDYKGFIDKKIYHNGDLSNIALDDRYWTILCRTNKTCQKIEEDLLWDKAKFTYHNLFPQERIERILNKKDGEGEILLASVFGTVDNGIKFLDSCKDAKSRVDTIHKSKGLEWDNVVVVNSFDPKILEESPYMLTKKEQERLTFIDDIEARNIHYVACTRAKKTLKFYLQEETIH